MNAQSRDCAESIEAVDPVDYLRLNMLEFQRKRSCYPDMQGSAFAFGPARKAQWHTLAAEVWPDDGVPVREHASFEESALAPDWAGRFVAFGTDGVQAAGSLLGHVSSIFLWLAAFACQIAY